jgi:hypothetical protein
MLLALLQDLPDVAAGWGELIAPIGGLAFAALLVRLALGQADKRAAVAEKREEASATRLDLVLEDNRTQASTIKEQSTTLLRVAALAEDALVMAKSTSQKIDDVLRHVDRQDGDARRR